MGGLVVLDGRGGVAIRQKPTYRRSTSPAQAAVEARMVAASALWSSMDAAQVARWRAWGEARGKTAQTAFVALATKVLQIDPAATVPLVPPARDFVADDLAVTVSEPLPPGRGRDGDEGVPYLGSSRAETGERPHPSTWKETPRDSGGTAFASPSSADPLPQGGGILFSATGPNRAGSVTELLVQRLPNERRSPTKRYGSAGFVAFAKRSTDHLLPLAAGSYAVGYRFVEKATGQQGPTILLGVVRVG